MVLLPLETAYVPLRADSRHAIGLFRLQLKDRTVLTRIAALSAD